jgi:GxxExxY protein
MRRALLCFLLLMAWTQRLKAELTRPHITPLMETIRRSAEAVMARHGSGCTEAMYQRALQIDLYHKNICSLAEVDCFCVSGCTPIFVGRLDLEIDHRVILELKTGPKITMSHIQQLRKYIKARISTGMNVEAGAIVCFTERDRVEILELDIPRSRSPYFKLSRSEVDVPDPMEAS